MVGNFERSIEKVEEAKSELDRVLEQLNDLRLLQINIKEIHLNPADYRRLNKEVASTNSSLSFLAGVKIVQDGDVQIGKIHVHKEAPATEHSAQSTEPIEKENVDSVI